MCASVVCMLDMLMLLTVAEFFASDEFDKGDTGLFTCADGYAPHTTSYNKIVGKGFLTYVYGHAYVHVPYTGNIWRGKILVNHAGKNYWQEKFAKQAIVSVYAICDRICKKGSYTRIRLCNFEVT